MEELMLEMKQDTSRLPLELTKLSSVSAQLKLDELSTLSRMASKSVSTLATAPGGVPSVITESSISGPNRSHSTTKEQAVAKQQQQQQQQQHQVVLLQESAGGGTATDTQFQLTYASGQSALVYPTASSSGAAVQLAMAGQPGLAVTPEGMIVYSVAPRGAGVTQYGTIQQSNSAADTTVTSSYAAAISVPSYVDGNLYLGGQTLQLMPVSGYWPTEGGAMVQQGNQTILQPVQYGISAGSGTLSTDTTSSSSKTSKRVITID